MRSSMVERLKRIDKCSVFVAIVLTFALGYYINPLVNVELTEWDRTFSLATIDGISIDRRVSNFYQLFFL